MTLFQFYRHKLLFVSNSASARLFLSVLEWRSYQIRGPARLRSTPRLKTSDPAWSQDVMMRRNGGRGKSRKPVILSKVSIDPAPDRFPGYNHAAFGKKVFNIRSALSDLAVSPYRIGVDLKRQVKDLQARHRDWYFFHQPLHGPEASNNLSMPFSSPLFSRKMVTHLRFFLTLTSTKWLPICGI